MKRTCRPLRKIKVDVYWLAAVLLLHGPRARGRQVGSLLLTNIVNFLVCLCRNKRKRLPAVSDAVYIQYPHNNLL
jgi:hypothetical protein